MRTKSQYNFQGIGCLIPILLRPKLLVVRNYLRLSLRSRTQLVRDVIIFCLALAVMFGLHKGSLWVLVTAEEQQKFVYLHPSLPLGLVFMFLFAVLFLANAAAALSSLFLSQDLDLILSSPVSLGRVFISKFWDVLVSSSWVSIIFLFPFLFAYVRYYHPPWTYYIGGALLLFPYFVIPTAGALLLVILYARFFPAKRTRETSVMIACLGLGVLYLLGTVLVSDSGQFSLQNIDDVLRLVSILTIPNTVWMPSYWISTALAEPLAPTKASIVPYVVLLFSFAALLFSAAYLAFYGLFYEGFSRAQSGRRMSLIDSRASRSRFGQFLGWLPRSTRALVEKEYRLFSRDITQLFQVLLLGGVCLVYFYNFRMLTGLSAQLPENGKIWWQGILFLLNNSLEAFLMTAVGTRFVFQCISLEGRSYWLVQTSPISLRSFVWAKFIAWMLPIGIILSLIFGIGAYAITGSLTVIGWKLLSSWIICYGIVGLAVGLGAYFANFSWEHSSQLVASFGSMVYMLASVLLVALDGAFLGLIYLFHVLYQIDGIMNWGEFWASSISCGALLMYMNVLVTRCVLAQGIKALEQRAI